MNYLGIYNKTGWWEPETMKEYDKRVKCIEQNMDEFIVEVRLVVS